MKIQYITEHCDYLGITRQRPKTVTATDVILPLVGTARDGRVQPLALIQPNAGTDPRPLHTDRGHLIALNFGGPEDSSNLVPMYGGFNSPGGAWGGFETALTNHLNKVGNAVDISVTMTYGASSDAIPSAFDITVGRNRGDPLPSSIPSPTKLLHTQPVTFFQTPDQTTLVSGIRLQQLKEQMEEACWYVELQRQSAGRDKAIRAGSIAPEEINFNDPKQKAVFYGTRPLGFLDFIELNYGSDFKTLGGPNVSNGLNNGDDFTSAQVDFILQMSVVRELGYLKSSLSGVTPLEPFDNMMVGSTDASAQVDHIWPQQLGGSNCYSNARVVSAWCNQKLKAKDAPEAVANLYRTAGGLQTK